MIDYGIKPFDICIEQPLLWHYCKYWFIFTYIFASFFLANSIFHLLNKIPFSFSKISQKSTNKKEKLSYSLIEPPLPTEKLKLLIRRKCRNKRTNLLARKKSLSKHPNHWNDWNWKN